MADHGSILGQIDTASAAKNPIRVLADILKDPELGPDDKRMVVEIWQKRFFHRRIMAYLALSTMIASLGLLFVGIFFVENFGDMLSQASTLITWMEGFLAGIVATYYGMSALKPAS